MNIRAAAARVICAVHEGRSLSDALPSQLTSFRDERDQAFLQALCYGVCRWYFTLERILDELMDKPLKEKDQDIYALLMVGIYQLSEMRVPAHAAVAETVAATKSFNKDWAKGLVNAVLRNYQRHMDEINHSVSQDQTANYSHPDWFIEKLQQDWPEDWQTVLDANNEAPPFALRVNQKQLSRDTYLEKLATQQIKASSIPETQSGLIVDAPMDVQKLPGFAQGEVSVQDGAAQLAAELLELAPGQSVLDACAAPGGKTTHILELQTELEKLVAIDNNAARLKSVKENLVRLNLAAECICADVGAVNQWWNGIEFDRILLDAPCSASGVVRRHPDIKLLRRATDIAQLAEEQLRLLTALWPTLKPGGLLVYATCSVFSEENTHVMQAFLAKTKDAEEEKITANWGKACIIGRQILPGMHHMDGFYFARLKKRK